MCNCSTSENRIFLCLDWSGRTKPATKQCFPCESIWTFWKQNQKWTKMANLCVRDSFLAHCISVQDTTTFLQTVSVANYHNVTSGIMGNTWSILCSICTTKEGKWFPGVIVLLQHSCSTKLLHNLLQTQKRTTVYSPKENLPTTIVCPEISSIFENKETVKRRLLKKEKIKLEYLVALLHPQLSETKNCKFGQKIIEHSRGHKTSRNAKKAKVKKVFGGETQLGEKIIVSKSQSCLFIAWAALKSHLVGGQLDRQMDITE